jgi:hypothetical protein
VVFHDRQQGAGTSGKDEVLIRILRRMLATPPQPMNGVKVGYQASDGPDRVPVKATKKKPRATAGLKLIERRYEKGLTG